MRKQLILVAILLLTALPFTSVLADKFSDTSYIFKHAGQSSRFFDNSYGYAIFPTIGKAGIGVGGAYGTGRVYKHGSYVGNVTMTQLSIGFQLGAQGFSQIVFLQDERAFKEFTGSNFEFGADAGVVVITAGAQAGVSTSGSSASASGGRHDATTAGEYYKGMAIFTVTKGGLMYAANLSGQKFSYQPLH
ncbi:MAG: lipid-binding SYLF domain-containing protein [Gammaproteobacteria bacterium]|nr:lipid-binding SYLF domain-containing protein [Gammaproteobacteria bacterium]MBQ0840877.1 lipid-binding SYLF domain-containing protein [Gammaproteobacteria bacterium]